MFFLCKTSAIWSNFKDKLCPTLEIMHPGIFLTFSY